MNKKCIDDNDNSKMNWGGWIRLTDAMRCDMMRCEEMGHVWNNAGGWWDGGGAKVTSLISRIASMK